MKEQKNTNPKRIAVDVDDTLVESVTDFLAFLKIRKNIDVKKESFTTYYDNFAGMDKKEIDSLFLEFENTLDTFDFHDKATSTLQKLKEEGHELFVLTTRPTEIKEKTITLLEKEFGKNFFTDFYFSVEFGGSKARVYKEMNFDLLIDDADHHAKAVAEIGGNVLLFEQPWNKTMMEDPNIRRVKNWEEIGKLL
ncbi:hypothetical protein H6501_03575 [Candidatus Woesearchaeota archaeon]|nr:hypothetical protein [Nanoarchaeota archaeon]MCB9370650.1 hypothetical protein [Candidatus Woesearchaeota archaeon]USN43734.1 MAG: hypothetical protein H6500_05075 [Candidatus Woesearchaeota archaeon]